jgi:hypothetical protein
VSFAVVNPVPTITWLNPFYAIPNGPDFTLTVNGTGFVNGSVVRWNGEDRTPTYISSTQLTVAIAEADITAEGTAYVTVLNPAPGGGASNTVSFLIGTPKKVHLPLVVKNYMPPPAAPELNPIDNTDGDGSYTVVWNAVAGAASYTLEEDDNGGFASPTAVADHVTSTSWLASGRTNGTYFYRVKATSANGDSAWSKVQSALVPPPDVPELNPIANAAGDAIYAVSWKRAARAASYTLEEDDNVDFTSPTTLYAGTGDSWNATCSPAGTHHYRVRANNGVGSSGWSNVQSTAVQNAIRNPGFECGTAGWQEFSAHGWPVIINSGFPGNVNPHAGPGQPGRAETMTAFPIFNRPSAYRLPFWSTGI